MGDEGQLRQPGSGTKRGCVQLTWEHTDTATWKVGSRAPGLRTPHAQTPSSSSVRLSKVTAKARFAGWSPMDTRPLLTSLSDLVVSAIVTSSGKHGYLHQISLFSVNSSSYRHCMLRDPPTVPGTVMGGHSETKSLEDTAGLGSPPDGPGPGVSWGEGPSGPSGSEAMTGTGLPSDQARG